MTGYTRQNTINDGESIDAADVNLEFDQQVAAMNPTTGHTHSGSAGEGAPVPQIKGADGTKKVTCDNTDTTVTGPLVGTTTLAITGTSTLTGNVSVGGTVDGRDVAADGTKLDGIDASATDDQTGAEIKTLYEAEASAFTDAQFTKLAGIETSATADQTNAEIKTAYEANADTNEFSDAEQTKLAGIETAATIDQTDAEIRTAVEAATDSNVFTDADHTKLNAIEASATADQTDAEIRTAVEAATDSNVFTDADHTKLNAIEASATADQTGAEIKTAYEAEVSAFTDAQFTKLAGIETSATADQTGAQIKTAYEAEANAFTDAQFTKLAGIETSATADQSAAEILTAIKTVDGAASGLDADLLDGVEGAAFALLAGATFSGAIAMGTNDVTGIADLAVGATSAAASASVDIVSTTQGFLGPRMSTSQRDAISAPASGLQIYNSTTNLLNFYDGTSWAVVDTGGGAFLPLAGGTMSGDIAMGTSDITGIADLVVGTTSAVASAAVEVVSTTQGILFPRMTTTQRDAISAPATGLQVYNTTTNTVNFFNGTVWGTASQTDAEVKTAYENNADTNEFSDAEQTKLAGIETAATADQTGAQIKTAYEAEANAFTDAQFTKLAGIETSATADQSAAELLTAIKTVDGAASGLDADLLDGVEGAAFALLAGATFSGAIAMGTNDVTGIADLVVGTTSADASASVEIVSTTQGILFPRMTTTQRDAIGTPATGLQIYNTTTNAVNFYNGSVWGGATGFTITDLLVSTTEDGVAVGATALDSITTGINNVALGHNAGTAITEGQDNVAVGYKALTTLVTGDNNVAIGSNALTIATGDNNFALGTDAGLVMTTGTQNVMMGYKTGAANSNGDRNVAIGYRAMDAATSPDDCIAIGANALGAVTSAPSNVAIGSSAGVAITSGAGNMLLGTIAGLAITTGSDNICIGNNTDTSAPGASGEVVIGRAGTHTSTSLFGQVTIADDGPTVLVLKDTNGAGTAANMRIDFVDSADVVQAIIQTQASSDDLVISSITGSIELAANNTVKLLIDDSGKCTIIGQNNNVSKLEIGSSASDDDCFLSCFDKSGAQYRNLGWDDTADEYVLENSSGVNSAILTTLSPVLTDYTETTDTTATDASLDFNEGNTHTRVLTGAKTFTLDNAPAAGSAKLELFLTAAGNTVTWPTVTWEGTGTAPTLGTSDRIIFTKYDSNATIYALHMSVVA